MKVIAISGWKGSGKDTVAGYLIKNYGAVRTAFADPLKDMTAAEYEIERSWMDDPAFKEKPLLELPVTPKDGFSEMIANFMTKEFKPGPDGRMYWTPRALCILKGSTNRSVDKQYWVQRAMSDISKKKAELNVITDLRYRSEAEQLKEKFGTNLILVRINRFEKSPSSDPSERDLDSYEFDFYIDNTRDLTDTYRQADEIIAKI
jgi:hypothetical protein